MNTELRIVPVSSEKKSEQNQCTVHVAQNVTGVRINCCACAIFANICVESLLSSGSWFVTALILGKIVWLCGILSFTSMLGICGLISSGFLVVNIAIRSVHFFCILKRHSEQLRNLSAVERVNHVNLLVSSRPIVSHFQNGRRIEDHTGLVKLTKRKSSMEKISFDFYSVAVVGQKGLHQARLCTQATVDLEAAPDTEIRIQFVADDNRTIAFTQKTKGSHEYLPTLYLRIDEVYRDQGRFSEDAGTIMELKIQRALNHMTPPFLREKFYYIYKSHLYDDFARESTSFKVLQLAVDLINQFPEKYKDLREVGYNRFGIFVGFQNTFAMISYQGELVPDPDHQVTFGAEGIYLGTFATEPFCLLTAHDAQNHRDKLEAEIGLSMRNGIPSVLTNMIAKYMWGDRNLFATLAPYTSERRREFYALLHHCELVRSLYKT